MTDEEESEWLTEPFEPQETSQVLRVFPGAIKHLMPDYDFLLEIEKEIPAKWLQLQRDWFFNGIGEWAEFHTQAGLDAEKAYYHLACIQDSYQPKHEHKELAVAFLASIWFTDETRW